MMLAVLTPERIVDALKYSIKAIIWISFEPGQRHGKGGRQHGAHMTAQECLVGKGIPEQRDMAGGSVTWCTC